MEINNFDIKSFLQEHGFKVQTNPNGYQIQALWRGGKGYNVSINKKTGLWYDFVDVKGGNLSDLVKIVSGDSIDTNNFSLPDTSFIENLEIPKKFDKNILKFLIKDYSYWNKRGISNEVCEIFGGGVADYNTMPKLGGRYLTPIFSTKLDLEGFTARYTGNNPSIKKQKNIGIKKNFQFPLYINKNYILETKTIYLIEGMADLYTMFECGFKNTLCLFGLYLSPKLLSTLISLNPSKIIICENNDEINKYGKRPGQEAAINIEKKLLQFFDSDYIKIVNPKPYKDLNEALVKNGKEFIEKLLK